MRPLPRNSLLFFSAFALMLALAATVACVGAPQTEPADEDPTQATSEEAPRSDRYVIKVALPPSVESDSTPRGGGRLLLFFVPDTDRWVGVEPASGPFFQRLQPIASIVAASASEGTLFTVDDAHATVFGGPLNELTGAWRVQAVLDTDFTQRGHRGPGNLYSESKSVALSLNRADEIQLELVHRIEPAVKPARVPGVEWIERESALLTKHFGKPTTLRAGVVLPYGYDDLSFDRRMWPTIYVIGGFGVTHRAAADAAAALRAPEARSAIPPALWVFLDAESAWGHHGFCAADANGPVGRALIEEFIPFLEARFRIITTADARVVTGHSSGGWTALHLQLTYPLVFGACFASAPNPVDFSAFQRTNLYRDASLFLAKDGSETPSLRGPLGPNEDRVFMTARDEVGSEYAIDPTGRSGEQWSAWNAMWSPLDPTSGAPRALCDPQSGAIDPVTVEAWSKHDFAKLLERDPKKISALFATRIRIICGSRDSFYLNEAVAQLQEKLAVARAAHGVSEGAGSIEIIDGLTHDTTQAAARLRFHRGIVEHLRAHGLGEAPPRAAGLDPTPDTK